MQDTDNKYCIFSAGKLLPGFDAKQSISLFSSKARMGTDAIKKLLSIKNGIIKNNLSLESAQSISMLLDAVVTRLKPTGECILFG